MAGKRSPLLMIALALGGCLVVGLVLLVLVGVAGYLFWGHQTLAPVQPPLAVSPATGCPAGTLPGRKPGWSCPT